MSVQLGGLSINNPLAITPNTSSPAPAPKNQGYFWKGADGKVYVQGSRGINAAGNWDGNSVNYWQSRGFTHTPDSPAAGGGGSNDNGGGVSYGSNDTGGGGGGGSTTTTQYQDKSNDIAMQNAGLGQVDATQNTGIDRINKALSTIMGEYDADANNAKTQYGKETNANQGDLQTNKQTALEDAVQGRRGLFSTLAGLGALSGTGIDLANHAVEKGANEDLTTAADTYATNQNALDTGYNAFTTQDKVRRTQAQRAAENDTEQIKNDAVKSRQAYLTNLANDYQDEGKTAEAKNFASQAAALFPEIASTNVPTIDIGYSGSAYTAPTLSQYVGQANNTTVQSTPATGRPSIFNIPGLVALNRKQPAGAF